MQRVGEKKRRTEEIDANMSSLSTKQDDKEMKRLLEK
jgi:hypothetical protein